MKLDENAEIIFKQILNCKEVPNGVAVMYLAAKKLADRADIPFKRSDFVWIALMSPMSITVTDGEVDIVFEDVEPVISARLEDAPALEEPEVVEPVLVEDAKDEAPSDDDVDTGPDQAKTETETGNDESPSKEEVKGTALPPGTLVEFMEDEDILTGKIVGTQGTEGDRYYTVEVEGVEDQFTVPAGELQEV